MQSRPSSDWSSILLAFVFLGATGFALKLRAPSSARGQPVPLKSANIQDADLGLVSNPAWADPLRAPPQAQASRENLATESIQSAREPGSPDPRTAELVLRAIARRTKSLAGAELELDVVTVLTHPGFHYESREKRRRQRYAIYQAASRRGMSPLFDREIAQVTRRWPSRLLSLIDLDDRSAALLERSNEVAIEAFQRPPMGQDPGRIAVVCWVPYESVELSGRRFAQLLTESALEHFCNEHQASRRERDNSKAKSTADTSETSTTTNKSPRREVISFATKILGPSNSDELKSLREEVAGIGWKNESRYDERREYWMELARAWWSDPRRATSQVDPEDRHWLIRALLESTSLPAAHSWADEQDREAILKELSDLRIAISLTYRHRDRSTVKQACEDLSHAIADCRANGPGASSYLELLQTLNDPDANQAVIQATRSHSIQIYSNYATAQSVRATSQPELQSETNRLTDAQQDIGKWFPIQGSAIKDDVSIAHYTVPDTEVIKLIQSELKNRLPSDQSHILLIREAAGSYANDFLQAYREGSESTKGSVYSFEYIRGLDGIVHWEEGTDSGGHEFESFPSGRSQVDYLARLASRVREFEEEHDGGIGAVGVIGSDVYDKQMILQALKPVAPHAIFFTTDADARIAHGSQYEWTRNLLVGSGTSLWIDESEQANPTDSKALDFPVALRGTYQVSTFLAAWHAFGRKADVIPTSWQPSASLFEVGRNGLVPLTDMKVEPAQFHLLAMKFVLSFLGLFLLIRCLRHFRSKSDPYTDLKREPPSSRYAERFSHTRLALYCGGIGAAILIAIGLDQLAFYSQARAYAEPYSFMNGVSSWPRVMWLALASLTSFILLLGLVARQRHYCTEEYWRHQQLYHDGLGSSGGNSSRQSKCSLQQLNQLARASHGHRVLILSGILAFAYTMFFFRFAPTFRFHQFFRDDQWGWLAKSILVASNFFFSWMCAYYLTTLFLYIQRIRSLLTSGNQYPDELLREGSILLQAEEADPAAVDLALDSQMIGRTSAVIGDQMVFPFISLALVMLGLSSFFDASNFSASWVVFHAIPITLILGSSFWLRFEAEGARRHATEAIDSLLHRARRNEQSTKAQRRAKEEERKHIGEKDPTAAELELLRQEQQFVQRQKHLDRLRGMVLDLSEGAFGPWHHRPAFRSLLYPLGSGSVTWLTSILARHAG